MDGVQRDRGGAVAAVAGPLHPLVADTLLLAAFNAADPRQIDGVGGASSTTSKAAIVQTSDVAGVDVSYAFEGLR
ncbi:PrpF domain-containing protein [Streptomyces violaceusniger]|uniref:Uncharacterized protein n=1 Tax=Streptomyces violaceusniger TaxID=68280 RepID=A0A4D4KWV1_STRVO|nr:hypothetical protein SVIO_016730 [Streptomyces violaceusniger]